VLTSVLCRVGAHRWGALEVDDEGQKHTCARCGHTAYLAVGPTQGPSDTYGSQSPPKG
jgi:hypothetical protein